MTYKDDTDIITHKLTPRITGFKPDDLISFIDNPDPTKKRVSTKRDFE